jgi:neutral trehalase
MYRVVTCLFLLLVSSPLQAHAEEGTYCDDPAVWTDWHEKATKHTGDLDFQTLHALWIGLCTKVRTGTLTEDEANTLFERAHGTVLQQRREVSPQRPVPQPCKLPGLG